MTQNSQNLELDDIVISRAEQLLSAKKQILHVRSSFYDWCVINGYQPAKHHQLIINELQSLVERLIKSVSSGRPDAEEGLRLMVLEPPGSAKSTYISKLFPPWFLAQINEHIKDLGILACSHSGDLASDFGRAARNLVESNERWLGYSLTPDSRAADKWATTNRGYYQSAGVGAGISGRRAHLGVIDDFCGTEEEAGSKTFNDKIWNWYLNDFVPRLQPHAARVIIANHRNEDDLVGRLMATEASKWRIIKLRLLIETHDQSLSDPLGRHVGEWLWPEYFTKAMVDERMQNPRASGIQQQEPSPEKGGFFQKDHFQMYKMSELPSLDDCRCYAASDHAVRIAQQNDRTCMGIARWKNGILYIDPDLVWDRIPSNLAIKEMLRLANKFHPLYWWAERENISGSIGPILQEIMQDEVKWINIVELATGNKELMARAQSFQTLMALGRVRWPDCPWFQRAQREMLMFPNGSHDDFVSFVAHLGRGVHQMISTPKKIEVDNVAPTEFAITMRSIKQQEKIAHRDRMMADR